MRQITEEEDVRRWKILAPLFPKLPKFSRGEIYYFGGMSAALLGKLIDEEFADPTETQNDSPEIQEILAFLVENPSFRAHGYIVDASRSDCRVSVEGVESDNASPQERERFISMFRQADEFDMVGGRCRAWYD